MTPRMSIIASAIRRIFAGGAGTGGTGSVDQGDPFWSNVVLNMRMEAPTSTDPHWSSVVLAMHMDGANGSTTFTDLKGKSVLLNLGSPVISTTKSKFGGASLYLPASGLYTQSSTDFEFGSGDFTIEFWSNTSATTGYAIAKRNVNLGAGAWYITVGSTTMAGFSANGSNWMAEATGPAYIVDQWNHVAVVRSGTSLTMFVNGVAGTPVSMVGSVYVNTTAITIGSDAGGQYPVTGYIDDLRITKGVARYTATFTPPTAAFLEAGATDPYWSSVVLSIPMDGADDGAIFTDLKGHTITRVGTPMTKTATKKFGTASAYFDGTADRLSITHADCIVGTGDFTMECFVRFETKSGDQHVMGIANSGGTYLTLGINASSFFIYRNGGVYTAFPGYSINTWYHIAIQRFSGSLKLYIDGVLMNTASDTSDYQGAIVVGGSNSSDTYSLVGNIDEFRLTKGIARYTANFTPPTEATNPTDDTGKTVTVVGNAAISTIQKKYGSSSCYFDGTGDYLTVPDSVDLQLDTGDFTMEMWIYMPSYPASGTYMVLASKYQNASTRLVLYLGENTSTDSGIRIGVNNGVTPLVYGSADGTFTLASQGLTIGVWHHIAVVRNSGKITVFMNGTALTKTGNPGYDISYPGANLHVGAQNGGIFFNGYIDDLRITKGIARYTANFTPAAISSGPMLGDPYYGYTTLLLRMNGADMSTTFTDESHTPKTVTRVGDTQLKTAVKKYGTASGYFDGVGDYLTVAGTSDFVFGTGDFTIELWVNTTDTNPTLVDFYSAGNNGWQILLNGSGQLIWYTTAMVKTGSIAVNTGVWKHVAVVRHSGLLYFFVDGVMDGSSITHTTDLNYATPILAVGAQVYSRNEFYDLNGYIDDLRITKGIARYTTNFSPPPQHLLGEPDPSWASVILAMHMDDAALTDLKGGAVTLAGGASRSAIQSKFGGYSAYLNGSNQHLSIPTSSVYDLGTSNFTIEMWVRFDAVNIGHGLLSRRYDGAAGWCIVANETTIAWRAVIGGSWIDGFCSTTGVTFVPNKWYHVALVRIGSAFTTYIDGILRGSATNAGAIQDTAQPLRIGVATVNTNETPLKGYIDDLRITKGIARYTTAFIPPGPFSDTIGPATARYWKLTTTAGGLYSSLKEFYLANTSGDLVTSGKTYDSNKTSASPISTVFDGVASGAYIYPNQNTPLWVSIDFGSPVDVTSIGISTIDTDSPTAIKLERSSDGVVWEPALILTGLSGWITDTRRNFNL